MDVFSAKAGFDLDQKTPLVSALNYYFVIEEKRTAAIIPRLTLKATRREVREPKATKKRMKVAAREIIPAAESHK